MLNLFLVKVVQISNWECPGIQAWKRQTFHQARSEMALTHFIPKSTQILQVGDRTFGITNSPVSNSLLREQRACVYDSMFQRSHSDFYLLLPYMKGPYRLSSSSAFMSRRWLNKNAERRCRPWLLTSLKGRYECRANNYLPCHSKCSARQRSWLTCYSCVMHV